MYSEAYVLSVMFLGMVLGFGIAVSVREYLP